MKIDGTEISPSGEPDASSGAKSSPIHYTPGWYVLVQGFRRKNPVNEYTVR